ncbi:hypothetical protein [Pseudonocardia sp. MH-G8]|uniref:hypothetical protein n=1 Tax=Pseudonocardia sp. MH-G8 TaxID=1854588 RepID=UPI000BA0DE00|nr:hypothetical protein [Pseudonocardia sp. MH-G8]OZM80961.1 hypothetical protein CFP66_16205 [Pseudonocardia sp. MH-G8]
MTAGRHRSRLLAAVFASTVLLAGCGAQPPAATSECPWNETGPQLDGSEGCAGGAPPAATGTPDDGSGGLDPEVGRIAMSADGNQHDNDDWASAPMALAMLAHRDLQPNLVHYDYNNHIWDSSQDHVENMTESVQEGGERFGFDMSRFFDDTDPQRLEAGTQNLVEEINASTEDDQLSIVLAGPIETVWMALDAADPEARTHVECITHGDDSFNQTHGAQEHGGHDYEDLIDLGCERVEIPDQNSGLGPVEMDFWDFLDDSGDENWKWLYSRLDVVGNGDVSDAGMVFYVITGEEESDRSELKSYLES